jgi:hypothetical protein
MIKKNKNIIKALVIFLFLVMAVFEGMFFYIQSIVKPESYRQQVLDAIKLQTGQDVKINGEVRFSLFPSPKLVFYELEVDRSASDIKFIPIFSIEKVEINIAPMSILSEQIKLSAVTLVHPVLALERADDDTIHWDWLNTKLLKALNSKNGKGVSIPLFLRGGILSYSDTIHDKNLLIEEINASTTYGSQISLNGTMKSAGQLLNFVIDSKVLDLKVADNEFPLNLSLTDSYKNALAVQSVIDTSSDTPKVSGNFSLNTDDVTKLLYGDITKNFGADEYVSLPMSVNGKWSFDDGALVAKDVSLKGMNSEGSGGIGLRWNNWYPTISVDLDFLYMDQVMWSKISEYKNYNNANKKAINPLLDESQSFDFRKENPLPENIEVKLNINAQKVLSGKEEWKNIRLNAVLDKGAFTVNQFDINLSGDGVLSLFGVVSQGGTGELRFEGNMEAKGKSLRDAVAMFYSSAGDLPSIGTGEFSVHSNVYINATQVRLFEAEATIDGTSISGTITAYPESILRFDTQIKLKNINLDYARDMLRKENIEKNKNNKKKDAKEIIKTAEDEDSDESSSGGFAWLKNLPVRVDAKVYIDDFTFMERKGERLAFALYAYRGDLRISNLQFIYPDGISEVNCNIDVRGLIPHVNLMINADKIDASYFSMEEPVEGAINAKNIDEKEKKKNDIKELIKKSEQDSLKKSETNIIELEKSSDIPVPLSWMEDFNGVFDITLRRLTHKDIFMDKIKFQAKLDNKKMTIQKLGFIYSQAQTNIIGTVYGGKVPGMNISFTMSNADIYEIMKPLSTINNITGFTSMSGLVATNGWSFKEWLQQMDAKFLIVARGVKVQGINLDGVKNVVEVARSSADVFNNVNNVVTKGTTEFSVDGSLNIREGELRAPSMTIKSGFVTGSIVGGAKLDSLDGQFSILFRFANLLADPAPTLIIQLSGKMDKPDIKVDTASLEDFVARRNVSK